MKEKINRICNQNDLDFVFSYSGGQYTATVMNNEELIEWFQGKNENDVLKELLDALDKRITNGN